MPRPQPQQPPSSYGGASFVTSSNYLLPATMSNQQNFVRQAATECFDFSAWNGALNVPLEEPTFNFNVETSASGTPLFSDFVRYGPQETQMGGDFLDNDAYSAPWPPINSGSSTPRCDPISNESLVRSTSINPTVRIT